jgi:FMN-dependent oxidoreductase (nitrilotriacetate monooxygenase family)
LGASLAENDMAKAKMHLGFDLSYSHMGGRWRMPGAWEHANFPDVGTYEELARIAERGLLDFIFSGDGTGVPVTWRGERDAAVEWGINWPRQDLNPIFVSMSRVTRHVGYGLTYSSTFMHPYYTARLMNSLDHVTNGRIAMNLVASTRQSDAENFGFEGLMDHASRYERMEEFVDVCNQLWASVEADAMVWDRASGRVGVPSKIRDVDHNGRFFKVKGPLNTPPSPQGKPVIVQAGGSPRGIRAAAKVVDHAFAADMSLDLQVQQRHAFDEALTAIGRDPSKVGILWQTPITVGETEAEALARREKLLTLVPLEAVGAYLSHNCGYDFSRLPGRFSLQALNEEIIATQASPVGFVHELIHRFGESAEMTPEEFFEHGRRNATGYTQTIAGDARQLADILEEKFEATGSRGGFMLGHTVQMPADLIGISDLLVPELQRRGRFRTAYRGRTLRENLAES